MNIQEIIEKKDCTGCMACYNKCPKKAITMQIAQDGFWYPTIDSKKCIECGLCKNVCPVVTRLTENQNEIEVYACKNRNESIRMQSSSGGIFTLIAQWILSQEGVVFGARFDENKMVHHAYIENEKELEAFRGSKYLQSRIENNYEKVKEFLNQGRKVLFTGTPCQIEGLFGYLEKDYSNLYTQDIICHGVPSPKVWEKYIKYKENQIGQAIRKVNFRNKKELGWKDYQVNYQYDNKEENEHHKDDIYMRLFLKNLDLRESCYDCQFKKLKRKSDITIADFWGIDKVYPEFNDGKGVSVILVNSKKGKAILENIKEQLEILPAKIEDIVKYNSSICKSATKPEERSTFFSDLEKQSFEDLIEKYL